MAKIDLKFIDDYDSKCFISVEKLINKDESKSDVIRIRSSNEREATVIYLDKSTAIKFAKTIRTEIAKIKE